MVGQETNRSRAVAGDARQGISQTRASFAGARRDRVLAVCRRVAVLMLTMLVAVVIEPTLGGSEEKKRMTLERVLKARETIRRGHAAGQRMITWKGEADRIARQLDEQARNSWIREFAALRDDWAIMHEEMMRELDAARKSADDAAKIRLLATVLRVGVTVVDTWAAFIRHGDDNYRGGDEGGEVTEQGSGAESPKEGDVRVKEHYEVSVQVFRDGKYRQVVFESRTIERIWNRIKEGAPEHVNGVMGAVQGLSELLPDNNVKVLCDQGQRSCKVSGLGQRSREGREPAGKEGAIEDAEQVLFQSVDLWDTVKPEFTSAMLDVSPYAGDAKGVVEAVVGRDLVTGQEIGGVWRYAGLVPLVGVRLKGIKSAGKILRIARTTRAVQKRRAEVEKIIQHAVKSRKTRLTRKDFPPGTTLEDVLESGKKWVCGGKADCYLSKFDSLKTRSGKGKLLAKEVPMTRHVNKKGDEYADFRRIRDEPKGGNLRKINLETAKGVNVRNAESVVNQAAGKGFNLHIDWAL